MKELQILVFQRQLQLALDYGLPVNIHSRYAGHYCTDTAISMGLKKVHMHAYDGRANPFVKDWPLDSPIPFHHRRDHPKSSSV